MTDNSEIDSKLIMEIFELNSLLLMIIIIILVYSLWSGNDKIIRLSTINRSIDRRFPFDYCWLKWSFQSFDGNLKDSIKFRELISEITSFGSGTYHVFPSLTMCEQRILLTYRRWVNIEEIRYDHMFLR